MKFINGTILHAICSMSIIMNYCYADGYQAKPVVRHIYFGNNCLGHGGTANCSGWIIKIINGNVSTIYDSLSDKMAITYKYSTNLGAPVDSDSEYVYEKDFEHNEICITDPSGNPYPIGSKNKGCYGFYELGYLDHDGNTGSSITLNRPADGDILINGAH